MSRVPARGRRWFPALVLCACMVLVPLLAFAQFNNSPPAPQRLVAAEKPSASDVAERSGSERASRDNGIRLSIEEPTTNAPSAPAPTVELAAAAAPAPVEVAPPPTSAKPKPKPKPAPTTTARPKPPPTTTTTPPANREEGAASFFDAAPAGTCAHRSIPLGTVVTVTNLSDGRRTTCRVADRGPFIDGRVIDLSRDGFASVAALESGVVRVAVEW